MSVKVATNRLIVSSLNQSAGFYQQLISKVSNFQELGNKLVREAEAAQVFRQFDKLQELALVLSTHPIREYQLIGQFHLGWGAFFKGENPQSVFESVAEYSTTYKATAFIALGTLEAQKGNYESELGYYRQAVSVANNPTRLIEAVRGIAVVKSKEGYNQSALKELERVAPLIRYASPTAHYAFLNSLAVELGEVGRVEEAQNVCKVVLASPFAFAYPEWRETANEIALRAYKSCSSVSVLQPASENIVPLPVPELKQPTQTEPARVLSYLDWKKKMGQEDYNSMTETDLLFKIFNLTAEQSDNWLRLRKIVDYILKVSSEPC